MKVSFNLLNTKKSSKPTNQLPLKQNTILLSSKGIPDVFCRSSALIHSASSFDIEIDLSKITKEEESELINAISSLDASRKTKKENIDKFNVARVIKDKNIEPTKDFKERVIKLIKLSYTDLNEKEQKVFKNFSEILDIATDEKLFKSVMELGNLEYVDFNCKKRKVFKLGTIIKSIAKYDLNREVTKEFKERAVELAELTCFDMYDKERNIFQDDYTIFNLANNEETFKRAVELAQLTCLDSYGVDISLYTDEWDIESLAKDKEKFDRIMELANITYIDSRNGIERKVFDSKYSIEKAIEDDGTYKKVLELAKLTCNNGKFEKRVFENGTNIVDIVEDESWYKRITNLLNITRMDKNGNKHRLFNLDFDIIQATVNKSDYDKALKLADLSYVNSKGEICSVYTQGSAIRNLIMFHSNEIKKENLDKVIELAKLSFVNSEGIDERVFIDENLYLPIVEDVIMTDDYKNKAIELAKISYINSSGNTVRVFKNANIISGLAEVLYKITPEFKKKATDIAELSYLDSSGNEKIIFTDEGIIAGIAGNQKMEITPEFKKKAIDIAKLSYFDSNRRENRIFTDEDVIASMVLDKDCFLTPGFKKRATKLSKLTYTNSFGSEKKIFDDEYTIYEVAKDKEWYDRVIKVCDMSYVDMDGDEKKIFITGRNIAKIAKDLKKQERVERLAQLTYTASNGEKKTFFPKNEYDIVEIAKDTEKFNRIIGFFNDFINSDEVNIDDVDDLIVDYVKYQTPLELLHIYNINQIPNETKKILLKLLVKHNSHLFNLSETTKRYFPLIPTNEQEYCELLPKLAQSVGIATNSLNNNEIAEFNTAIKNLSNKLSKLSDNDFNNVEISQEYSKEEFIKDVYEIVKNLDIKDKQKIFDYFGFELILNDKGTMVNNEGLTYSIIGYPSEPYNKNLPQINYENAKNIIEELRKKVVCFCDNNKVICNNKEIENDLNKVITYLPELRTTINRLQHKTHSFDIFKHSLKVMQKIAQNPSYVNLSDSDKKILMLASLVHDIAKTEGQIDPIYPENSAFDSFFITKKFDLNKDEEAKLYSLIKDVWLASCNRTDVNVLEKEKEMAFKLQTDNLFELSKIFTQADLQAVKKDDEFFDKYNLAFKNISFDIEKLIHELKTTQPMLPVTKFPSASRINEAIEFVNSDGSTNLKGIYENKNGLIVIRYNEVENETWEKIGFKKGTISKGIEVTTSNNKKVSTGNIKFFVHGLDDKKKITKFDVFNMPNSDDLLSVSYAELPESKFAFYRKQGLILNTAAKYIYGGGETDSGSGNGKNIRTFIDDYTFKDGSNYEDRIFISKLIKDALKFSDEEYIEFYEKNKTKSLSEIEPEEIRNKLIEAYASINSSPRKGERKYNEMYISNPYVMGVFVYPENIDRKIGDTMEFVDSKEDYLKQYAIEHNIPMVVFGN